MANAIRARIERRKKTNVIPERINTFLTRKKKNQTIQVNILKEYNFHNWFNALIRIYGIDQVNAWYWRPDVFINGLPNMQINVKKSKRQFTFLNKFHSEMEFDTISPGSYTIELNQKLSIFSDDVLEFASNFPSLKMTESERYALYRYYNVGALHPKNNMSLTIDPEQKKEWKINFELFGSFFNSNSEYCGLFSNLESRCRCDAFTFKLKPNMKILVHPPPTKEWVKTAFEMAHSYLSQNINTTIWMVVPLDAIKYQIWEESPFIKMHETRNITLYDVISEKKINKVMRLFHYTSRIPSKRSPTIHANISL